MIRANTTEMVEGLKVVKAMRAAINLHVVVVQVGLSVKRH